MPSHPGTTEIVVKADIEHIEKLLHKATISDTEFVSRMLGSPVESRQFVFYSDEPAWLGGDDQHPAPLEYVAGGVGL